MYITAVQIAKTYEYYLELSWIQVLMYFYIYVMVSRIDSGFFGGGSQHMVLVHQAFRKSRLSFLWTSCDISWFSFVCLRNLYAFFMHFLCSSLHFLCNSFAFLMQFFCISYAIILHFLCTSYAVLMQFKKLHTLLPKLHTLLPKTYEVVKTAEKLHKKCIRIA